MARDDGDHAAELRAARLRATPQRRAILAAFAGGDAEHLSAEEIHARASVRVGGIGRGTVYATLADLSEAGLLAAVGDQDPVRYELNTAPHDHFRCRLCLRLFDVTLPAPSTRTLDGFVVESVAVVAEGVCRECGRYADGLRDGVRTMATEGHIPDVPLASVGRETAAGPLVVAATADGVARVAFPHHAAFAALAEHARARRGPRAAREHADAATEALAAFLDGDRHAFDVPIDTAVLSAPLEATQRIGWGELRSYHRLGDLDAYDCGYAMGTNPVPLLRPCHRVARGHEAAADYVGGPATRRFLARLEGQAPT